MLVKNGDLRRDPAYEGDIVPEGMQTQEAAFGGNHMGDDEWRSPDLSEVIDYLSSRDEGRVANAAAYLQHLTYGDDGIKNKTRGLNGIPVLVELLNNKSSEIHRSACGALRNISFGKGNEENKVAIKNANGVATLIRLLRHSQNAEIREMVTGTLWNLSSSEWHKEIKGLISILDLRRVSWRNFANYPILLRWLILDEAVRPLLKNELIPETGWDPQTNENVILQNEQPWSRIFLNCLGVIRNVSLVGSMPGED
ncbi:putative armadillo repeat protein deleted in velo-cardio-facial syndrome-like [Apostichopus japonicus]|uniref:Putative armadillo repeat protein deleted in velo-cardio-facial syndrome-like n=1 Tax=Stichopus japonicus TaxID=307972 RepID=A0A2G8JDC6_STIJA|nr:putative armadillo repeat protein deleted in velo-cardio-facial syndrome-like [Apostichopus japonicus]